MSAVLRTSVPQAPSPRPVPSGEPADRWTWRTPAGRALSAAVGVAALGSGFALGGAVGLPFWAALVAPDLVFLRKADPPATGPGRLPPGTVGPYNTLHDPRLAAALLAAGVLTASRPLLLAGLGWTAHIAVDRACGFGLRRPDGAIH
ncbi:DUF4260 family protein [Streptomyces enissocaesilis]|uniref:DUF4260 family protein n=1 Tax=Streptomyces enissocaesilis TaxID=332589 RepID=A0ABP6JP02_9ACTN